MARRGGEEVGGAAHKAAQTANAIFITDRQGIPVAISEPKSGKHHDVHEIEASLDLIFGMMANAGISIDGIYLNADAGFGCHDFRRKISSGTDPLFSMFKAEVLYLRQINQVKIQIYFSHNTL